MNAKLTYQTLNVRDITPRPSNDCVVWGHDGFLHICFNSIGCRFRKAGYCTMCDYGGDHNLSSEEALHALKSTLQQQKSPIFELLLGTCGSILDESEMPWEVLRDVLTVVNEYPIPTIILETHYTTVTDDILSKIQALLPAKEIIIEMGFESSNPSVLKDSLNKYMDLDELEVAMKCVNGHGMCVVLNVFLGAPFLTPEEQNSDAQNSIAWAIRHGANRVVVFPANIKPNTLLWKLYNDGKYQQISHWQLIEMLAGLDVDLLEKVELSWYGDRQNEGQSIDAIPPKCCDKCKDILFTFYHAFAIDFDGRRRKELIEQLLKLKCNCAIRSTRD